MYFRHFFTKEPTHTYYWYLFITSACRSFRMNSSIDWLASFVTLIWIPYCEVSWFSSVPSGKLRDNTEWRKSPLTRSNNTCLVWRDLRATRYIKVGCDRFSILLFIHRPVAWCYMFWIIWTVANVVYFVNKVHIRGKYRQMSCFSTNCSARFGPENMIWYRMVHEKPAHNLVDERERRSRTLYRKLNKCKCKVLTG